MLTVLASFLHSSIVQGVPLLFGATGEILTEKSGHLNLGIPGIMYVGGISGIVGGYLYEHFCERPVALLCILIPLVCSFIGSGLMALIYCFLTVTLRANQNVTGLALTTFGTGVGNFLGMKPESLSDSRIYGIELDSISGRIAQQLYQTSSIAVQGFEKTELPDSFFDVAIGNVPFGDFKLPDKKYDKYNFLIHDYFFAKTLDKVRPGGIIAFVTSKGTMDKTNPNVRKYIAQRADLLGAIRLPNDTFKGAAGTEVTSDILFFQKRDTLTVVDPGWVHLATD